jgi:hypothetical protein
MASPAPERRTLHGLLFARGRAGESLKRNCGGSAESAIRAACQKENKHHYIPVFYLKQWAGSDDRICEFSKPSDRVKQKRVHPDGTAYVRGLNKIPGLPPHEANYLETYFMQLTDNHASRALRILLGQTPWRFTNQKRSGWSRFIVSLVARNPESVQRLKTAGHALFDQALPDIEADYARRKQPTYAEYAAQSSPNPTGRAAAILIQKVIDHSQLGNRINQMRWMVLHDARPKNLLLTSDRPIVMTNGIAYEDSQIILPISPRHIFVATNNATTENYIRDVMLRKQMIEQINDRVVRQSHKFVYGFSDAQLSFVSRRLGMKYTSDPVENLPLGIPER